MFIYVTMVFCICVNDTVHLLFISNKYRSLQSMETPIQSNTVHVLQFMSFIEFWAIALTGYGCFQFV